MLEEVVNIDTTLIDSTLFFSTTWFSPILRKMDLKKHEQGTEIKAAPSHAVPRDRPFSGGNGAGPKDAPGRKVCLKAC